jgi:hypothetical protein
LRAPEPAKTVSSPVDDAVKILFELSAMYMGQPLGAKAIPFGYVRPAVLGMKIAPPALTFLIVKVYASARKMWPVVGCTKTEHARSRPERSVVVAPVNVSTRRTFADPPTYRKRRVGSVGSSARPHGVVKRALVPKPSVAPDTPPARVETEHVVFVGDTAIATDVAVADDVTLAVADNDDELVVVDVEDGDALAVVDADEDGVAAGDGGHGKEMLRTLWFSLSATYSTFLAASYASAAGR